MPEMRFSIRWPDGAIQSCYSPSLIIKEYLEVGQSYPLDDFLTRGRTALTIASERVREKYGYFCSSAMDQLAQLEATGACFADRPDAHVRVEAFDQ